MLSKLQKFLRLDSGAVSVEWVVLTALVIGLTGASAALINGGTVTAAGKIGTNVENQPISRIN